MCARRTTNLFYRAVILVYQLWTRSVIWSIRKLISASAIRSEFKLYAMSIYNRTKFMNWSFVTRVVFKRFSRASASIRLNSTVQVSRSQFMRNKPFIQRKNLLEFLSALACFFFCFKWFFFLFQRLFPSQGYRPIHKLGCAQWMLDYNLQ